MILTEDELKKLRGLKIIDENALRIVFLSREIEKRVKAEKKSRTKIKEELAEEYNITIETLNKALYRFDKKKVRQFPIKELK